MTGAYQFDTYMASAREALREGDADAAMDWLHRAISLSRHLEEQATAQAYHLKAEILVAQEEYGEAEEALQKSLDLQRQNAKGYLLLGELMLLDGRHERAASAFKWTLEIEPENAGVRSLLIFCYAQLGEYDKAGECFDRCVSLDPEFADSYYHMGICLFLQGKAEAKELLEEALSHNPILSGPHYYMGRIKITEADFAGAQRELEKELELNPANSLAELQLIRAYLLGLRWQEVVELFDQHFPPESFCEVPALKSCRFHFNYEVLEGLFPPFIRELMKKVPHTPENLFHVARMYRYKSLAWEGIELLKTAIEADRSFRPAYAELAELYRIQNEPARACEALGQAAAVFGDAEAYSELARGLLSSGRYDEAEEAARKAVSLNPHDAEAHCLLGAILTDAAVRATGPDRLMKEARESLLKALRINPSHTVARTYLMHTAFHASKTDECLELAETALKDDPDNRVALLYSGRCLHATGKSELAEERLQRLLELYPDDREARGVLAEVYRAKGKLTEAVRELEEAMAVPGRHPPLELLLRLAEIYLLDVNEPTKAREYLLLFLQTAPPGHPGFDRAKELLDTIKA